MIQIDKAIPADLEGLLTVINKAYRGEASGWGWTHELNILSGDMRIDGRSLTLLIKEPGGALFVAKNDSEVVGSMHLRHDTHCLYLGLLAVDPDLQNFGVGKKLLTIADEYALQHDFSRIFMVVISERKELIDWYVRRGYTVTDKKTPFRVDPKFGIPKRSLFLVELIKVFSEAKGPD